MWELRSGNLSDCVYVFSTFLYLWEASLEAIDPSLLDPKFSIILVQRLFPFECNRHWRLFHWLLIYVCSSSNVLKLSKHIPNIAPAMSQTCPQHILQHLPNASEACLGGQTKSWTNQHKLICFLGCSWLFWLFCFLMYILVYLVSLNFFGFAWFSLFFFVFLHVLKQLFMLIIFCSGWMSRKLSQMSNNLVFNVLMRVD